MDVWDRMPFSLRKPQSETIPARTKMNLARRVRTRWREVRLASSDIHGADAISKGKLPCKSQLLVTKACRKSKWGNKGNHTYHKFGPNFTICDLSVPPRKTETYENQRKKPTERNTYWNVTIIVLLGKKDGKLTSFPLLKSATETKIGNCYISPNFHDS